MTAAAAKAEIGHNSAAVGEMLAENPEILFREKDLLPALIESIEKEIADQKADASTEKGRKAMKSLAYSIATRKTKYDEAGKALNEELRKQVNTVDVVRKSMREQMDALRDKAKAPADAWDKKEDDRKARVVEVRTTFADAMRTSVDMHPADIDRLAHAVEAVVLIPEVLLDFLEPVRAEQQAALAHLSGLKVRIEKAEADRIELERLRTEKAEAERKAAEAAAAEAKKKADDERIAAAAKRAAEEAVEAERKKAQEAAATVERERAAEQAKRDAEAVAERAAQAKAIADAEEARRQADAKAQAAIDEANRKAKAAEEALEAERRAEAEKVEAARKAKAAQDALDAERQRNLEHRSRVMGAAKQALMDECEVSEAVAKKIILSIVGKSIPHVSMEF